MTASKPAPPKPAGPGPKPGGPSRPQPSGPPPGRCDFDLLFAAVDAILVDLQTPARQYLSSAAAVADGPDFRLPRDIRCPS